MTIFSGPNSVTKTEKDGYSGEKLWEIPKNLLRLSLIIDEEESGEEAQEGEPGQHRHGVRRQGVQSRQDAVHFEGWRRLHHLKLTQIFCFGL